ncbi:MAG: hypothetical protein RBU21_06475 [FCB group bacterium]|jgi:uncharacterized protein YecT (DUF1311 family)|nr:hypothetical protein [FCB group bacterium]
MKSAYEKAMERLERETGPTQKLTGEQKARIAEIDKKCDAQAAEKRLSFDSRIVTATTQEEFDGIQADLANELAGIESRRQREKEAVWNETKP